MVVELISQVLSIPEPAARFLFGLLLTYPLALVYRPLLLAYASKNTQSIFCAIGGCALLQYVFGLSASLHFLFDVVAVYCVLLFLGTQRLSLLLMWIITMGHLTIGYVIVIRSNQIHPIFWTIPHCVLVLRLIGLAHDLYDGTKPKSSLSDEQKERCVAELPSFIEYFGYSYFFATILSGPQISFIRYKHFVSNILFDNRTTPSSLLPGLQRLLLGIVTSIIYSQLNRYFPLTAILADEFQAKSLLSKLFIMIITGKLALWRYMAVWTFAEATCVIMGISYKSSSSSGSVDWTAVYNVNFWKNETNITLQGTIESFNIQTNRWASMYVFKRLKWLQNKMLSHFITIIFLSLWHGLWPGYFICLTFEFIAIICERQFIQFIKKNTSLTSVSGLSYVFLWCGAYILKHTMLMYPLMCFMLLSWSACWQVRWKERESPQREREVAELEQFMSSVYWIGHMVALVWFLFPLKTFTFY